jgi:acyl carrier protein phosphodiesterase
MTASSYTSTRKPKEEGSIASVFSSLSGSAPALPTRFADLKKDIWQDSLVQSWREVLDELYGAVEEIAESGIDVLKLASTYVAFN